jgi:Domain of unknown function (DUF4186)
MEWAGDPRMAMGDLDHIFERLGRSRFRSRFHLRAKEQEYLQSKGLDVILDHGRDFIEKRLAPAEPDNDGRQTPMSKHPIFVAQHATATCCRGCLEKWHAIPKGRPLSSKEKEYVMTVLGRWLRAQMGE